MSEYKVEQEHDRQDLLDFANMVFSMNSGSTDFAALLPKAYLNKTRMERFPHYVLQEQGRIKALVDVYPLVLRLRNTAQAIKVGYVGTVSVHPDSRNKGYMRNVMEEACQGAEKAQQDLLVLDGNRHRYQYYGFEKAGVKYCFNLTEDSIQHGYRNLKLKKRECEISFVEITDKKEDYLEEMYGLYCQKRVTVRSREDFFLTLQSWNALLFAVVEKEKVIGYLNLSYDMRNILEMEVMNVQDIPRILYACQKEFEVDEMGINIGADEIEKIVWLDMLSDYSTLSQSHQIRIIKYESVIQFLLMWSGSFRRLEAGELLLGITDQGNNAGAVYKISVADTLDNVHTQTVKVERVEGKPDICFTSQEFVRNCMTGYYWYESNRDDSPLKQVPAGWFPLPFFLPEADAF